MVEVITGIVGALGGLFGGDRVKLTSSDWNQIIKGSGFWTDRLRSYLARTIHYNTDTGNVGPFTNNFIYENREELTSGETFQNESLKFNKAKVNLYNFMKREAGGIGAVEETISGLTESVNQKLGLSFSPLVWIIGIGIIIYLFINKKNNIRRWFR